MIKAILLSMALILAFPGCQPKETNVKYTLSDEQLSRLMFDLQLSEVAVSEVEGAARDSLSHLFWLKLTEIYKMSKPEITEEIRKLETDPVKMKVIMDQVQIMSDSIR
jgi:dGTP triphosphohydrolase